MGASMLDHDCQIKAKVLVFFTTLAHVRQHSELVVYVPWSFITLMMHSGRAR